MKVAILQSNYIPWKGYFDIINSVDQFIWYDDVQYTPRDWRNRNRIKTTDGLKWLTVPCNGGRKMQIREVEVSGDKWRRKHWTSISHAYARAPFFAEHADFFEDMYLGRFERNLSKLNHRFVEKISRDLLGVKTRFTNSSDYWSDGAGQDRLMGILQEAGATTYFSGPAGKAYIDEALFEERGIAIEWMDYSGYPEYPQLHGDFEHGVSILDLLFNVGADAPEYIWGWRDRLK